jgi:hypothetical protein
MESQQDVLTSFAFNTKFCNGIAKNTRTRHEKSNRLMAKRLRRSMVEHQKVIHVARLRRQAKETANRLFIEEHGFIHMRNQQDLLFGTSTTQSPLCDVDVPMQSITVDEISGLPASCK